MDHHVRLLILLFCGACSCDPTCPPGQKLVDGACEEERLPPAPRPMRMIIGPCKPGEAFCAEGSAAVCNADGMSARATSCISPATCLDGACVTGCIPGESLACAAPDARAVCGEDGLTRTASVCPSATPRCLDGECLPPLPGCIPGDQRCDRDDLAVCEPDGMTEKRTRCTLGCAQDRCLPTCEDGGDDQVGCEFVAVELDNEAQDIPFAITVSNVTSRDAQVRVELRAGISMGNFRVPAGDLLKIPFPMMTKIESTSRSRNSLRVISDTPVTVHQFNPINQAGAFSNDASLLLPTSVGGTDYLALTWKVSGLVAVQPTYVTIVATSALPTHVEITPKKGDTFAGVDVDVLPAGMITSFDLVNGEVLSIGGDDMTGTRIQSDRPITVFVGQTCANVPVDVTFCDHLEEQLLPTRLWGSHSVVAKMAPRGTEPDVIRVIAARDGTVLSTVPSIPGLDGVTLNAGEDAEAATADDFVITSTDQILVSQFIVGADHGCPNQSCTVPRTCFGNMTGIGDPSQMFVIPSQRFATEYQVLVPDDYAEDHLTITGPAIAKVEVDGVSVRMRPIGNTGLGAARLMVGDGLRRVTSDLPVGLYVYGYDCNVSYAYPGGLR